MRRLVARRWMLLVAEIVPPDDRPSALVAMLKSAAESAGKLPGI